MLEYIKMVYENLVEKQRVKRKVLAYMRDTLTWMSPEQMAICYSVLDGKSVIQKPEEKEKKPSD